MGYISHINRFRSLNAIGTFGSTDTTVRLYLLNQCNLRCWQHPSGATIVLGKMGFIDADMLKQYRAYAFVLIMIVTAIITRCQDR